MLFDERDLNVFQNDEAKTYFSEILQMYYCKNYRGCVVQLYSFVVYDLYKKLQTMAIEKNVSAQNEIEEVSNMIKEDDKYSTIECKIIEYFKKNYSNYFDSFIDDIEYLKKIRNNCAHLKVNGETLFVPSDYQIRMLICSMYDHIFSVKAPFITKLFSFVKKEIEDYSINNIGNSTSLNEYVVRIQQNHLDRMTKDSLKNSYEDFIKLSFVTINDDTNKNLSGLYVFVLSFTDFIIKKSYNEIFYDKKIKDIIKKIKIDEKFGDRTYYLLELISKYDYFSDMLFSNNQKVFDEVVNQCKKSSHIMEKYFEPIFARKSISAFDTFKENYKNFTIYNLDAFYNFLKKEKKFDFNIFINYLFLWVPNFNGFSCADSVMDFLIKKLDIVSQETIDNIAKIYSANPQFYNRICHRQDIIRLNEANKKLEHPLTLSKDFMVK